MEWAAYLHTKLMCKCMHVVAVCCSAAGTRMRCDSFLFSRARATRLSSCYSSVGRRCMAWKSKVQFNLLPANSKAISVRKHTTICAWILDMCAVEGCRVAFTLVSCHVVTQQRMIWKKKWFLLVLACKNCVYVHFNCRWPPSHDGNAFAIADFILSSFVVSDREMEK